MLVKNYWPTTDLYWPVNYWPDLPATAGSDIAGQSDGQATVDATLIAIGFISGSTTGIAVDSAILFGTGDLQGTASGSSIVTATGTVSQLVFIFGDSTGSSDVSGSLIGVARIAGTSYGASTALLFTGETIPMLSAGIWRKNQPNTILFVLTDNSGAEIIGLGSSFDLQISKSGSPFATGDGAKSEVGLGWYKYVSTAGEADSSGPVAIVATHVSVVQQNLEYTVEDRVVSAIEFTYTLTNSDTSLPIAGADISFSINSNPANVIWSGFTDAFGIARDFNNNLPRLSPGAYYIFSYKPGFVFENPDVETVS